MAKTNTPSPEQGAGRSPELVDIGKLCEQYKVSRAVMAGVSASQGWKPGKAVTAAEFSAAVSAFTGAAMSPKPKGSKVRT